MVSPTLKTSSSSHPGSAIYSAASLIIKGTSDSQLTPLAVIAQSALANAGNKAANAYSEDTKPPSSAAAAAAFEESKSSDNLLKRIIRRSKKSNQEVEKIKPLPLFPMLIGNNSAASAAPSTELSPTVYSHLSPEYERKLKLTTKVVGLRKESSFKLAEAAAKMRLIQELQSEADQLKKEAAELNQEAAQIEAIAEKLDTRRLAEPKSTTEKAELLMKLNEAEENIKKFQFQSYENQTKGIFSQNDLHNEIEERKKHLAILWILKNTLDKDLIRDKIDSNLFSAKSLTNFRNEYIPLIDMWEEELRSLMATTNR